MLETQEELRSSLKGQKVVIPHLSDIFRNWPSAIHQKRSALTTTVNERLENIIPEKASELRKADFALFTCCWWPHAAFPRLRILAYFSIWLFLWDDEIDQTSGALSDSFEAAQAWRMTTMDAVTYYLGLGQKPLGLSEQSKLIRSFSDIGEALCTHYSLAQRRRFLDEIKLFLCESQREQEICLAGKVETVDQYWKSRVGTSAVRICLSMIEYADDSHLDPNLWNEPEFRTVWQEANVIVCITNDLLSLKKELLQGRVYSLIPLTCATFSCPAQIAVEKACHDLRIAVEKYDSAAARLSDKLGKGEPLQRFLRSARLICTGNHVWSLETGRYGLPDTGRVLPDGIGLTL